MRVLLTGASGFIGSAVLSRLLLANHEVVAVARTPPARPTSGARWVAIDLGRAVRAEDWLPHLTGIDAVVNCAGAFQAAPGRDLEGVHVRGVDALFEACERLGIKRIVHISAIGVDRETPTAFSRTKRAGETTLMARDLDWVILRPSVVVGRAAYGGSALIRGLAALPLTPLVRGEPLQVVQRDDLVATVLFFLSPEAPARKALDIAGPQRLPFAEVVRLYRRWLGWPEARPVAVAPWAMRVGFLMGDFVGLLGWRPPVRSTAGREILRGAVGDPGEWMRLTRIEPRSLGAALAEEPASVQERWFARLYVLKPLIFVVLSLFWIITGLISLGPGLGLGVGMMEQAGSGMFSPALVIAGALADIAVGIAVAVRRSARIGLYAALGLSLFYVVAGTVLTPHLWSDPLGPMLKIWPIMALNLVALAILGDR